MKQKTNLNLYRVGDLVSIRQPILGEPKETAAYVYEAYQFGTTRVGPGGVKILPEVGISVITENGIDLGGFSPGEQASLLQILCHTGFYYLHRSSSYLAEDFRAGRLQKGFFYSAGASFSMPPDPILVPRERSYAEIVEIFRQFYPREISTIKSIPHEL